LGGVPTRWQRRRRSSARLLAWSVRGRLSVLRPPEPGASRPLAVAPSNSFSRYLIDLPAAFSARFALLDGRSGVEGPGPSPRIETSPRTSKRPRAGGTPTAVRREVPIGDPDRDLWPLAGPVNRIRHSLCNSSREWHKKSENDAPSGAWWTQPAPWHRTTPARRRGMPIASAVSARGRPQEARPVTEKPPNFRELAILGDESDGREVTEGSEMRMPPKGGP
jgi:hypothetical protein